jgi:predicted lipoprotein with Yx(FWY)xxD motif
VRTEAGITAGIVEVIAFMTLLAVALQPAGASSKGPRVLTAPLDRLSASRAASWAAGALCVLAAAALGVSLASTPAAPSSSGAGNALLKVTTIGGVAVLTNAQGLTLYWFGPDTPTTSACDDTNCTPYWPPVIGTPSASAGVLGALGTILRSDGRTQATYDGHPIYSYISDPGPGRASGNMVTLNGGVWHEMLASGSG